MKTKKIKFKKEIKIKDNQIIVKILDNKNNIICLLDFDKKYIKSLGNRYLKKYPYHGTENSIKLDEIFHFMVLDIQDKMGLAKYYCSTKTFL